VEAVTMRRLGIVFGLLVLVLGFDVGASDARTSRAQETPATPAKAATGKDACAETSAKENIALVERYWAEVWRAGGERAVEEVLAPDEIHHWGLGADTTGPEQFKERLNGFLAAFPDLEIVPDLIVTEGDLVVSQWTATGTHEGEFFGIPATGVSARWTGNQFFRIECGLIAESWGEADHLGLRQQLGIGTEPGTPVAEPAA
jgi:steroid delta-isomerase-like uncharacterized protein